MLFAEDAWFAAGHKNREEGDRYQGAKRVERAQYTPGQIGFFGCSLQQRITAQAQRLPASDVDRSPFYQCCLPNSGHVYSGLARL